MSQPESIVIIVAQDEGSCRRVQALLRSECLTSIVFRSIGEYVEFCRPNLPSCLVMDVQLPDGNGLEFQRRVEDGYPPIVFISDHCDVRSSVRAIKSGAVNFLTKPLSEIELMDSIHAAIDQDRTARAGGQSPGIRAHDQRLPAVPARHASRPSPTDHQPCDRPPPAAKPPQAVGRASHHSFARSMAARSSQATGLCCCDSDSDFLKVTSASSASTPDSSTCSRICNSLGTRHSSPPRWARSSASSTQNPRTCASDPCKRVARSSPAFKANLVCSVGPLVMIRAIPNASSPFILSRSLSARPHSNAANPPSARWRNSTISARPSHTGENAAVRVMPRSASPSGEKHQSIEARTLSISRAYWAISVADVSKNERATELKR